jgi:hypothetical protein
MTSANSALSSVLVHLSLEVLLSWIVPTSKRCLAMWVAVGSGGTAVTASKVSATLDACVFRTERHLEGTDLLSLEGQESTAVIQVVNGALPRRLF